MTVTRRIVLVTVSVAKRYLAEPSTPKMIALRYLAAFDNFTKPGLGGQPALLTAETVAAIDPACDAFHELYREIMKLVPRRETDDFDQAQRCKDHQAAWKVIENADTFAAFGALNPSLSNAAMMVQAS